MKSTDNTVFVRFTPPSSDVNRWHLEEFFSQVGPIKKCSVISSKDKGGLGYGFVKFVSQQDAEAAAKQCNDAFLAVDSNKYRLKVTLASAQNQPDKQKHHELEKVKDGKKLDGPELEKAKSPETSSLVAIEKQSPPTVEQQTELMIKRKRTSRVIVRNLSFYADEKHVKAVLEKEFGPVVELTLPRVNETLHRGFCFVTFESAAHARKATEARTAPLIIKKRAVAIDFAMPKAVHQRAKDAKDDSESGSEEEAEETEEEIDNKEQNDNEIDDEHQIEAMEVGDDESAATSDDSVDDHEVDSENGEEGNGTPPAKKPRREPPEVDEGVTHRKTVFVRNLPFDTTRNDIFQLLRKFGHIESIYPVMDKDTGVFKGTAFCSFRDSDAANRALEAASSSGDFQSQRDLQVEGDGLHVRGRRVFMDIAVDKQTASTLTLEKKDGAKSTGRDRRCLYLASEGYVASQTADSSKPDPLAWESLPESDQLKRQRALTEKTTKLKSPLFFINPLRLSIRNLAKHVDEAALKGLCVKALHNGLKKRLVKSEDQVAYWRAKDGLSAREVMNKISEAKQLGNDSIIPEFNEQNVKKYIPSVFIDRDFSANKKEKGASRGFGFVDFTHHAHALACLREMNNNPTYSPEYVPNGKRATQIKTDSKRKKKGVLPDDASEGIGSRVPRLIVEFTVENKAKAQQQITNRAKQQANIETQKMELTTRAQEEKKEKKKKHRGALQREKKRKQREGAGHLDTNEENAVTAEEHDVHELPENKLKEKVKGKPPKKQKVDAEDQTFEALVRNYTATFTKSETSSTREVGQAKSRVEERRWFE